MNPMEYRVGTGYDSHRFAPGRKLVLGGVTIPHEAGLMGHSDADALLHAVCDALLGAAAAGDIGTHFPDTDPRYKGAASTELLSAVAGIVKSKGWRVGNIDATIICQEPKLSGYIPQMAVCIAGCAGVPAEKVSVKAKTNEGLDAVGRKEGVAVHAVALICREG